MPRQSDPWKFLRTGGFLTASWIAARARTLLIINLVLAAGAIVITHRPGPDGRPVSVDFVSFHAAGALADAGHAALAYDRTAHGQAEAASIGPGHPYQFFFYPPPYLLLCAPLATLPYGVAFALFEALSLALFLLAMYALVGQLAPMRAWLPCVLAFTPLFWTIGLGQNAFLTAALFAAATLHIDRRPILAGICLGLLCYKPHFGLLVPVALLAGGRWRGFAAAAATVALLCALSWAVFGGAAWIDYLRVFLASGETYGSGRISFAGMVSPFGAARLAGAAPSAALALQATSTLLAAGVVAWLWRRRVSLPVRAAALLAGTMLALPVVLLYDQMVTLVALAWLAREGRAHGFLPWEKLALGIAFVMPMISFPLGMILHLPLAPLPALIVLLVCVARAILVEPPARADGSHMLRPCG